MSLIIVKQILSLALYVLAGVPINTQKDLYKPAWPNRLVVAHRVRDRIGPGALNDLTVDNVLPEIRLRTYNYNFMGRALFKGQPMAGAKVILRVTTAHTEELREVLTAEDGSYQIALQLEGSRNEPIDWEMRAYTPDMKKVELVGRRIAMREDDAVTVFKNLNLISPQA